MSKDLFEAREEVSAILTWLQTNPNVCVYCGMPSECKDHLIPRSRSGEAVRYLVPTVPACHDCNTRISDLPTSSIILRSAIVAQSLRKKYRKQLNIKDRTDEELNEFGRGLREKIRSAQLERQILRYRLRFLDAGGACVVPYDSGVPAQGTTRSRRRRAFAKANAAAVTWDDAERARLEHLFDHTFETLGQNVTNGLD